VAEGTEAVGLVLSGEKTLSASCWLLAASCWPNVEQIKDDQIHIDNNYDNVFDYTIVNNCRQPAANSQ
jgi:hypothetical protein